MKDAFHRFASQFDSKPEIVYKENLRSVSRYVLLGMGGSHLAGGIIQNVAPHIPLTIHRDYGLPVVPESDISETLFIASSYSGNTEEVLSGAKEAFSKQHNLVCISVGGELITFAKENCIPYIQIPDTHVQPRSALGYSVVALAEVLGDTELITRLQTLGATLRPDRFEGDAKAIAETLRGSVPIIYTSNRNSALGYNWKIKFNETGKIPAFYNVFPELNHNEMTGFDAIDATRDLSKSFCVLFITDTEDNPRVQERMQITKELYEVRGIRTLDMPVEGETRLERIFNSLLLADWITYYTAVGYDVEPEQVPMVEGFKKRLS